MPSVSIAELPVNADATNFVTAISRFPMIAAKIAVLDSFSAGGLTFAIHFIEPKKIAMRNTHGD